MVTAMPLFLFDGPPGVAAVVLVALRFVFVARGLI